jgi:hypothetical protein
MHQLVHPALHQIPCLKFRSQRGILVRELIFLLLESIHSFVEESHNLILILYMYICAHVYVCTCTYVYIHVHIYVPLNLQQLCPDKPIVSWNYQKLKIHLACLTYQSLQHSNAVHHRASVIYAPDPIAEWAVVLCHYFESTGSTVPHTVNSCSRKRSNFKTLSSFYWMCIVFVSS